LSVACAAAANPAAPATVLSRSRTFYDTYSGEASFGAAPTKGNPVRTEELSAWSGSTPVYVRTASNVYDSNGRVTAATDARSFTTTTAFTTANGGLVTQTLVTNPLGNQVTTVKEPAWDLPTTTTDPNGAVTDLSYDGLGRLTSVWLPGRAKATQTPSVRFTYLLRKSGGPTAVTTENLLPTGSAYKKQVTLYDGLLRQRQTQSQATGGGRLLTDTFYTTRGEVDWTSEAYYDSTNSPPSTSLGAPQGQIPAINSKRYDGAGRETDTILLANGVEKWRTTTAYGGDRVHTTPPLGGTATTAISNIFDETVELRQYHSPAQVGNENPSTFDKTTYVYGLTGSLQRVTDAAGNQWSYQYDLRGRQTQAIDPDKGTTTSTYDDGGNVLTTTSPLGSGAATVAYTYDALSRRTTMRDTSATGPKRAEWVYDTATLGIGKLARSIRWVGTAAYESRVNAYDTAGRPTSTSVILPATEGALCAAGGTTPCTFTTSVTYRANGSPFQTTLPAAANLASEKLTFGYNDVGEPSTLLTAAQIYVNAVVYNKLGQLTQRTLGATGLRVAITSTFDEPTRRVTTTNVVPELKPEAANWSYIYDNSGNITRIQEAPAGAAVDTQCFRYDHVRQLTDAWTPSSGSCATSPAVAGLGGPAPYWHSWTFNAIGNRLTEVRHAAAGDTTYTSTYPASGPTAVRPHALTQLQMSAPGTSWTHGYTYDNAGNTKTRLADTGNQQTLTFDPEGRLTTVVEAGATTSYLYDADGGRLIRRDPTATTLYLPDGSEVSVAAGTSTATGTRYYTHKGATIAMRTAAGVSWIVGDHHGTAELTIKASDLSSSKRRSLPYGQDRGSVPSGWPAGMDKGYVGGTKDRTGLTHLGVREYDPAIGRFISVDPVIEPSEPQQLHPYTYGHNTPVNRADPTGEWPDWLDSAVSTVASAVTTVGNAVANTVASTVESIAQDPVKFATGVAVGIVATAAVAAVCSTGVGCLILGAAVVGAASAGAEYGVDVAQGEREFSASDLMGEMAFGGATGVLTLGAGAIARKALSGARSTVSAARQAARGASGTVDDLAEGAATAGRRANSCMLSFDPDTPVLLASGAAVPIGSVQLGDQVVATDPISGVTAAEPVVSLFANRDVDLADVTVVNPDGTTAALHTTQNHPFWNATVGAWTEAGDLRPGDGLQTPSGAAVTVAGVTAWAETKTMYNLTVDALHTYYVMVGDAPVLVHNCTPTRAAPEAPSIPASNYRGRYNAERHRNGAPRLPQTWDAHHAVPQAYRNHAEFRGFDFDAPRNIRGVPGSRAGRGNNIHQSITNRWSAYQRVFPYASRVSIERRAARIDRVYARYYW
ncbi:MAG: polymorphic toxin-type HINT domain-containing protein, partial [Micromonosporaceae bacterium]